LRVKIKKHRWYPHILKTRDPITFSVGWRKFQSIPVFTMQDESMKGESKMRMIKYTPKFGHCYAVFYGPTFPVGTTFLGIQNLEGGDVSNFRICTTGVIVEMNTQFKVMKKLKLIGEPFKVLKNTAFIKGMFTSNVEVAKFQGASIKTVSGIRGSIKRVVKENAQAGSFRATFEDRILMSDIVFLKTLYSIDIPRFFNPIIAYGKNRMLKSHAELRRERDLPIPQKADS
jgi:ribosome biogenesis protein BMS1